jgi:polyferredoxin
MKKLKIIRVTLGIVITLLITTFFLDITLSLPEGFHTLLHFQFIPALMSVFVGSIGTLVILLLLTFLFGRVYCSIICPLGVFQDFILWLSKQINRKKKFRYMKELRFLRYIFLGIMVLSFVFGFTLFIGLLDPYSNYSRILTHLLKPIVLFVNNMLAIWFEYTKDYYLYVIPIKMLSMFSFISAIVSLLLVVVLSFSYGRIFCNTICPVGTILGLLSKLSIFKVRINVGKCNSCGLCEMNCKSQCIDSNLKRVDTNRCVDCFNCLSVCRRGALSYTVNKIDNRANNIDNRIYIVPIAERRQLLFGVSALLFAGTLPKLLKAGNIEASLEPSLQNRHPILPPGAMNIYHFNQVCASCHLCINRCPQRILKPAKMEYGLKGIMQPTLNYANGFCEYDCKVCSQVCPNRAIIMFRTLIDKQRTQIGIATYNSTKCQVNTMGLNCIICANNCPVKAISMVPGKKDLLIPSIDKSKCIGCGACEYYCPTESKNKAIWVEGLKVHKKI